MMRARISLTPTVFCAAIGIGAVLSLSQSALAQQADEAVRQCLAEVRQTMIREQLKTLYAGDQKAVSELCNLGDVDRATGLVKWIGAAQRCTRDLDAYIDDNNLDVAKDTHDRAYGHCRRADLRNAIEVVSGSPTKEPAARAEIVSFTASSSKVKRGGSVTLSWRTANADTVMLGRDGDFREVPASGSESVSPDRNTTYALLAGRSAKGPTRMETKTLEVQVSAEATPVTCTIFGRVTGTPVRARLSPNGPLETFKLTHVGVFVPGESRPKFTTGVDRHGRYKFPRMPGDQEFRVAPLGGGWRYDRRNERVSCDPGRSFRVDFHIAGVLVD